MISFSIRSAESELLDQEIINKNDLFQNLKELELINKNLGGLSISIEGIKKLVKNKNAEYHIVDIGCGGGDFLKSTSKWAKKYNFNIKLTGVDIKEDCINYASSNCKTCENVTLLNIDFNEIYSLKPDIIHASLFFHHLTEEEIISFITKAIKNRIYLVINDLERNFMAYYGIKMLTRAFSKSYLVKNDAPLSVLRGFTKTEWESLLNKIPNISYEINSRFAFRHLIIIKAKF